ncbi:hypothetical protein PIB30_035945 [Stylosanthes scabra]|uniref:NfeD-like C-terminal domain-containing protein n=1 Tax=Stylosanthes scabra TaxID=79078 RepID=A0ABU6ZCI2_9FABA|nr:hypothetical protein [Stylosanthes scabra]
MRGCAWILNGVVEPLLNALSLEIQGNPNRLCCEQGRDSIERKGVTRCLQPVQKYRVWDSGRSPNELTQGTILVVRKTGVAIVSVSE